MFCVQCNSNDRPVKPSSVSSPPDPENDAWLHVAQLASQMRLYDSDDDVCDDDDYDANRDCDVSSGADVEADDGGAVGSDDVCGG